MRQRQNRNRNSGCFIAAIAAICLGALLGGCGGGADSTPLPPIAVIDKGSATEIDYSGGSASITLNGSGAGNGGTYAWSMIASPSGATPALTGTDTPTLSVNNFNKLGDYKFQLTAKNSAGVESTATVTVNVYKVATATITVSANSFTAGASTLNFVPSYGGWNVDFPSGSVTYTLTSVNPTKDLNSYSGVAPASIYTSMDTPAFTQIFYYNSQEVGRRSIVAWVSSGTFGDIYNNDIDWTSLASIPAVTPSLSLSKKITSE